MARKKICGIYKIENLINGKVYIGQAGDIYRRWYHHKREININSEKSFKYPLYRAFRKYGIENFKFEIIEECSEEELNEKEIHYIKEYNSFIGNKNSNGYNQTIGGDGTRGRIVNEEEIKLMSERMKGKFLKGLNPNAHRVVCEGKEFSSILECAEYYNESSSVMANWIRGNVNMPLEWYNKGLRAIDKTMEDYNVRPDKINFGKNNFKSCTIICGDEIYYSLNDFKEKTGVSTSTVYSWLNGKCVMSKEWDDKGLRYLDGHTDNIIIHQDEEYEEQVRKNKEEAYRKLKEKELTPSNAFKVYCEGVEFPSVNKCAEHYGVNPGTMKEWTSGNISMPKEWYDKGLRREDKKMSDYKIRVEKSKKVVCDGIVFRSIKECAKYYNLSSSVMQSYLNKRIPIPQNFYDMKLHYEKDNFEECNYEIQNPYGKTSKIVICDGIEYLNVKPCAEHYGVNPETMSNWLNHCNKMPKKFYDMGLHYKDEPMENYEVSKKYKLVICENKLFNSIKECANYYNINQSTMQRWLKGDNEMPQEFKDKGLKYYE